jgi:thiamine monophosphate synthase
VKSTIERLIKNGITEFGLKLEEQEELSDFKQMQHTKKMCEKKQVMLGKTDKIEA